MDALVYNVGHLRTGRLSQDASSSSGNKTPSFRKRQHPDETCGRPSFANDPPRSEALGLVRSMRRVSRKVDNRIIKPTAVRSVDLLRLWTHDGYSASERCALLSVCFSTV